MLDIPKNFFDVLYNYEAYPGNASGFSKGANCQHYCYEFLRHFGFEIGNLRSSELWEDTKFTMVVDSLKEFDIVLVHSTNESYGAHIGVCIGDDTILHLSQRIGKPTTQSLSDLIQEEKYKILVGIKRPFKKSNS